MITTITVTMIATVTPMYSRREVLPTIYTMEEREGKLLHKFLCICHVAKVFIIPGVLQSRIELGLGFHTPSLVH